MARFTNGWIKLHRSLQDKDISQNFFLLGLWTHLLLIANWKEGQIIWQGKQRIVQPGEAVIGIKDLAKSSECSQTKIWTWLKYLQKTKRIVITTSNRGTLVTICNWSIYQIEEEEENKQIRNHKETSVKRALNHEVLSEEVKKGRREEKDISTVLELKPSNTGAISEFAKNDLIKNHLREVSPTAQEAWLAAYFDSQWIQREICKAIAWVEANPRKRPKSFGRFMTNWLSAGWENYRKTLPSNKPELSLEEILKQNEDRRNGLT